MRRADTFKSYSTLLRRGLKIVATHARLVDLIYTPLLPVAGLK